MKRRKRPASTARDPQYRHLWAARAVLRGFARGISQGASMFFDPYAMDVQHEAWKTGRRPDLVVTCEALQLLDAWSYDYPYNEHGTRCPISSRVPGKDTHAWVGPIDGA